MAEETKIIRIVIDSSKAVDGSAAATRALEKLERATSSIETTMGKMQAGVERVGVYLKAQLALMVAELGARFLQMAKDSLNAAAGLDELAEQLGVTTTGLQALQYSAVQNGVKLEQLETGITKFSQKMGEAAGGSKDMIEALTSLGVKNLDVQGKLRPTQVLLEEVAAAISKVEDPAKRSALAVDFFGKAGGRMLPMLKEIGAGFDDMAEKAARGGAMISKEAIEKLDKLADSAERGQLKMRALFAENAAGPLTAVLDYISGRMEAMSRLITNAKTDLLSLLAIAANPGAALAGVMTGVLGKSPLEKADADLLKARTEAEGIFADLGKATREGDRAGLMSGYARQMGIVSDLQRKRDALAVSGPADSRTGSDPDGFGVSVPRRSTGASTSAVKGAGQAEADKVAKLSRDTAREVDAATAYAAASERGAKAVADLEIHFKALKAAQDAYGNTADKNTTQVAALTAKIEEQLKAADRLKNLKDFNLGTEELERSNTLLEAENALVNANVEDRARELALIRLKNEVQAKGLDENNPKEREAIERRHAAIEQNERLKAQGEELKKANELWTAPLKSALESIQSTAADAFEGMLESGKFSFAALGDVVKKTVIRMIAEFAALAIVRPIMGSLIGGLQGIGLVSGSTASSLGYGGGASGGSGGGFSMPSVGGSGMFGSLGGGIGDWLNTPFTGPYAGVSPSAMQGVPMLSGSAGAGLTPLGAFAGAASIGMGAFNLFSSKSTAGKIGGGLGILGGGIGMASAAGLLPMLGAAGGPIGMGLGLAASLIPMLFGGGEEYQWAPLSGNNLRFDPSAGGYTMADTSQNGGKSMAGQFGGAGSTLDSLFGAIGGLTDPGKAFGMSVWNNQREGTTSTYLISPTQGSNQQTYNESGDPSKAIDRLIAKVFYDSVQNNAAMNASPTLRTALSNKEPTSVASVQALLSLVDSYDKLGKVTNTAEAALKEINAQFAGLTAGANEYGLSLAPIQAEQKKLTTRYAQDFIDGMIDTKALQLRVLEDQRKDSIASAEYIRDNVKDVYVDMVKITEYWNKKRLDIEDEFHEERAARAAAYAKNFQDLIRRLTYGDLANVAPDVSYAGTRGTYQATLAQAKTGDENALNSLSGFAEAYASSGRSYFASGPEYSALLEQMRQDLSEVSGLTAANVSGSANSNEAVNANLRESAELRSTVNLLVSELRDVKDKLASATAEMRRRA